MSDVFDDDEKRAIVGRAMSLHERLEDADAVVSGEDGCDVADLLDEWRELFPDEDAFERRLDRDDLSEADCRAALAADRLAPDEPLPTWVERLDDLVEAVQATTHEDWPDRLSTEADDPSREDHLFGPLSSAIVANARDSLPDEPVRSTLSESALESMVGWLQVRFERRFERVLYVEFKTFVAAHDADLAEADPASFEDPPTEYYEAFLGYLFDGGFADLCRAYPVFGRLLVTQLRQWEAHLVEFSRRLADDRDALAERFGNGDDLGPVSELVPLADDTHGDGRAVMRVTFGDGPTVVYKPRSVAAGAAFYDVLGRLDEHLPVPAFETPTYLDREDHGWMEWFEAEDPADRPAVERYYQRAGALLCVAYFLGLSDIQYENLVVAGEHPVVLDVETVLHPYVDPERRPMRSELRRTIDEGVLDTMLLPYGVKKVHAGRAHHVTASISGFALESDQTELESFEVPRLTAKNTDVMAVEYEHPSVDRRENVPTIDGTDYPPAEYVDEIVDGFSATYDAVLELRDDGRLSKVGFPDALAGLENRIVYRPTTRYVFVLRSMCSIATLRDGGRFGIEMESLAVPFFDGRITDSEAWGLYEAERTALLRFDPPRFTARTDDASLRFDDEPTGVDADASGIERCRRRIETAGPTDRREQVEFIRGCFGAVPSPGTAADRDDPVTADESVGTTNGGVSVETPPEGDLVGTATGSVSIERTAEENPVETDPVDREPFRTEAEAIFDQVDALGLQVGDGRRWASVELPVGPGQDGPLSLRPDTGSLYTGGSGIALLGAALYRLTGEARYREFAMEALAPLREAVRTDPKPESLVNLGGVVGIGSVAYGLALSGDLLGAGEVLDDAVTAAGEMDADLVAEDEVYDVVGGAAGTILGLLGAYDRRSHSELVSAAAECGDYLLDNRTEVDGTRVWETLSARRPMTGYAHGQSGIAYALVRLADVTGRTAYREAALEALEYEDETYSEAEANWPDFREVVEPGSYPDQWCHGRSGIGLARLGMAEYVDDERVHRGVDNALAGVTTSPLGGHDHLCCGEAGRAMFLLESERRQGRRQGDAHALLADVLERKWATGSYRTLARTEAITEPTLFRGVAGIGYAMLRVTAPETIPSVLLWE